MFDRFSNGYCPQCMLDGNRFMMQLNDKELWECPECHLQAHTATAGMFAVLRERGTGKLEELRATDRVVGRILTKADAEDQTQADTSGFKMEAELRAFLEKEVGGAQS